MLRELWKPPTLFQRVCYGTLSWIQLCEFPLWHLCVFGFLFWPWNARLRGVKTFLRPQEINHIRIPPLTPQLRETALNVGWNFPGLEWLKIQVKQWFVGMLWEVHMFKLFFFFLSYNLVPFCFWEQPHLVSKPSVPVKAGQQGALLSSSSETTSLMVCRSSLAPCWSGARWVMNVFLYIPFHPVMLPSWMFCSCLKLCTLIGWQIVHMGSIYNSV